MTGVSQNRDLLGQIHEQASRRPRRLRVHHGERPRGRLPAAGSDRLRRDRGDRRPRLRSGARSRAGSWPEARIYDDYRALLGRRGRAELDFVDVATPPSEHAKIAHAALDARPARPVRKAAGDDDRGRAGAAPPRAARRAGASTPATTTSTRRSSSRCAAILDVGAHRQGPPGDAADLPQHARQGRGRVAPRLAARAAPLGRRHRHGPRQPHLLPGLRVAARLPHRDHGARGDARGPYDTEDDFSCSLRFPTGIASAHLSWNAGVRKVLYTVHGEQGAVRVEDDGIEIAIAGPRAADGDDDAGTSSARRSASDWMDSSHVGLVQLAVRRLRGAPSAAASSWGARPRRRSAASQLITTAYASARDGLPRAAAPRAGARWTATTSATRKLDRRSCSRTSPVRDLHFAWLLIAPSSSAAAGGYAFRSLRRGPAAPRAHRGRRRQHVRRQAGDGDGLLADRAGRARSSRRSASRPTRSRCSRCCRPRAPASRSGSAGSASPRCSRRCRAVRDIVDGLLARKLGVASDAGRGARRRGRSLRRAVLPRRAGRPTSAPTSGVAAGAGARSAARSWSATRPPRPRRWGSSRRAASMRHGERAVYLLAGSAFTPFARALTSRAPSLALRELPIVLALAVVRRGRQRLGGAAVRGHRRRAARPRRRVRAAVPRADVGRPGDRRRDPERLARELLTASTRAALVARSRLAEWLRHHAAAVLADGGRLRDDDRRRRAVGASRPVRGHADRRARAAPSPASPLEPPLHLPRRRRGGAARAGLALRVGLGRQPRAEHRWRISVPPRLGVQYLLARVDHFHHRQQRLELPDAAIFRILARRQRQDRTSSDERQPTQESAGRASAPRSRAREPRAARARGRAHRARACRATRCMAGIVVEEGAGSAVTDVDGNTLPRLHRRHQRQRARPLAPDAASTALQEQVGEDRRSARSPRARASSSSSGWPRRRPRRASTGCSSTRAAPRRSRARSAWPSATPASTSSSASGAASTARRWARCR